MSVKLPARALILAGFLVGVAHAGETRVHTGALEYVALHTDGEGGVEGSLVLGAAGQRLLFDLPADTKVTIDGKPGTLPVFFALAAEHKPGALEVKITTPAGTYTAVAIELTTKGT